MFKNSICYVAELDCNSAQFRDINKDNETNQYPELFKQFFFLLKVTFFTEVKEKKNEKRKKIISEFQMVKKTKQLFNGF